MISPLDTPHLFFYRNSSNEIKCIGIKENSEITERDFISFINLERVLKSLRVFDYKEVISLSSPYISNSIVLNNTGSNGWVNYLDKMKTNLLKDLWIKIQEMEIEIALQESNTLVRLSKTDRF